MYSFKSNSINYFNWHESPKGYRDLIAQMIKLLVNNELNYSHILLQQFSKTLSKPWPNFLKTTLKHHINNIDKALGVFNKTHLDTNEDAFFKVHRYQISLDFEVCFAVQNWDDFILLYLIIYRRINYSLVNMIESSFQPLSILCKYILSMEKVIHHQIKQEFILLLKNNDKYKNRFNELVHTIKCSRHEYQAWDDSLLHYNIITYPYKTISNNFINDLEEDFIELI